MIQMIITDIVCIIFTIAAWLILIHWFKNNRQNIYVKFKVDLDWFLDDHLFLSIIMAMITLACVLAIAQLCGILIDFIIYQMNPEYYQILMEMRY